MPTEDILDRLERLLHHRCELCELQPGGLAHDALPALIAVARAARRFQRALEPVPIRSDAEWAAMEHYEKLTQALDALDALGREGEP